MMIAVAIQRLTAGKESELVALMETLTREVRANEPGCLMFLYVKSIDQPQTYVVIEQYKDRAAFDLHHQSSYLAAFRPKMMSCLQKAPDVITCDDVFGSQAYLEKGN